jgi:hypothetical protein
MAVAVPTVGAPGVYAAPESPARGLLGARMDVCAFAGIAPRGPARVPYTDEQWLEVGLDPARLRGGLSTSSAVDPLRPRRRSVAVPVDSWDAYAELYGRFEGPGRLPYAVASFFDQGGRRAYVIRIVHDGPGGGTAAGRLDALRPGGVVLRARDEGAWGNRLRARLEFLALPLALRGASTAAVECDPPPAPGSLLRLELAGGVRVLRVLGDDDRLSVATPTPALGVELVEATLSLDDGDGRRERHERLALGGAHPRRIGAVLCEHSRLVYPDAAWVDEDLVPGAALPPLAWEPFAGGGDGYGDLVPDDNFDASWVPGDERPPSGVHALIDAPEVASLVVADLYEPAALPPLDAILDPPSLAGPRFAPCVVHDAPEQAEPEAELAGLRLDPRLELDRIVGLQGRVVELAERLRVVALLDVPPGLDQRQIAAWRARFASSFAAAYHPWLDVVRADDRRDVKVRLNPSAVAAGIVAGRELARGVPFGPFNELATRVVDVADVVGPARHDELHALAVNVFLRERDGIRLTAGRTLAADPAYRQLSVRRVLTMIARTLEREMQWVPFEPAGESLRAELRQMVRAYLRRLYAAGAFAGATADEAFFVRCDDSVTTPDDAANGRLVTEIGVAPAEPLEFIVVRLTHDGDGTLLLEGTR